MDKSVVRKNYDKLIANNISLGKKFYVATGGTIDTPVKFLQLRLKIVDSFILIYYGKFINIVKEF